MPSFSNPLPSGMRNKEREIWSLQCLLRGCGRTFTNTDNNLPLAFSCVGGTGQADEGVAVESTQEEAQRFLMILGLGQGERPAHCCSSLAIKEAAYPWIRVFSSRLMASIRGLTSGLSLSGSTCRLITAQAVNMWTRRCSCCQSVLVSITVA